MDKKYIALVVIIIGIVGAIVFLGGDSYTSANISDVAMSEDVKENTFEPINTTETYSTDDNFHLTGQMNNVPSNTVVSAEWHYLGTDNNQVENTLILKSEIEINQSRRLHFPLTRTTDAEWPEGNYEARIYIEDKGNVENVQFSVHDNL